MRTAKPAFYAGLTGALAMMVLTGLLPWGELPRNVGLMLGSLVLREVSLSAWALGMLIHLCLGGVFAVGYAWIFDAVLRRSGAALGLGVAAAHVAVAGPLLLLVPRVHPLVPGLLPAPGAYLASLGAFGVPVFVAAHLLFGVIVGGIHADLPLAAPHRAARLPALRR
jgi:hypothetical protein